MRLLNLVGGFSPPIWNICSSNWIVSPNFRDENKQIFETTTQELFWGKDSTKNQLPNTNKCLQLKNAQRHGDDDKSTDKAWYGCFLKWWYPQIIHVNRVFHYKPSIFGVGNTHMFKGLALGFRTPFGQCLYQPGRPEEVSLQDKGSTTSKAG